MAYSFPRRNTSKTVRVRVTARLGAFLSFPVRRTAPFALRWDGSAHMQPSAPPPYPIDSTWALTRAHDVLGCSRRVNYQVGRAGPGIVLLSRGKRRRSTILKPEPQSLQRYFLLLVTRTISRSMPARFFTNRFSDRHLGQQFRENTLIIRG